jgi:hypothetical protein
MKRENADAFIGVAHAVRCRGRCTELHEHAGA